MVSHRPASSGTPIRMRLPTGNGSPGHQRRAMRSLITAARRLVAPSAALSKRPARSGMCMVSK